MLTLALPAAGFRQIRTGDRVPSFSLKQPDGKDWQYPLPAADSAEALIIAFWRPDQDRSASLLKDLARIASDEPSSKVRIVAVCSGPQCPGAAKIDVEGKTSPLPVLLDPDRSVYGAFGIVVTPSVGFIDSAGILRFDYAGYRRDFLVTARAHRDRLLGTITAEEHEQRTNSEHATVPEVVAESALVQLALRNLREGRPEMAEGQLRKSWATDPPNREAGTALAFLLLEQERNDEALEILNRLLTAFPDNPEALGAQGLAMMRTSRDGDGQRRLNRAVDGGAGHWLLLYEAGVLAEKGGKYQKAAGLFRKAIEQLVNQRGRTKRPGNQ
jgi:hypothetical protein